jgi:hypothetical protein
MTTAVQRAQIISSGEHISAIRKLGDTYSVEQYLEAIEDARAARRGEEYADTVLGKEDEPATDDGADILEAALADLKASGVDSPTYQQLADALVRVSS